MGIGSSPIGMASLQHPTAKSAASSFTLIRGSKGGAHSFEQAVPFGKARQARQEDALRACRGRPSAIARSLQGTKGCTTSR